LGRHGITGRRSGACLGLMYFRSRALNILHLDPPVLAIDKPVGRCVLKRQRVLVKQCAGFLGTSNPVALGLRVHRSSPSRCRRRAAPRSDQGYLAGRRTDRRWTAPRRVGPRSARDTKQRDGLAGRAFYRHEQAERPPATVCLPVVTSPCEYPDGMATASWSGHSSPTLARGGPAPAILKASRTVGGRTLVRTIGDPGRLTVLLHGACRVTVAVGVAAIMALSALPATASPALRSSSSGLEQLSSGEEPAGPWDDDHAPKSCRVTVGNPAAAPPASFVATGFPVPWVRDWYGGATLWVRLPRGGVLPVGRNYPGDPSRLPWGTKFPWWRARAGSVWVHARLLGGRAGRFSADVLDYTDFGFSPSGLNFSALGCWQLTALHAGAKLSFTVWAQYFSWA
jgi:hypothetical protein